MFSLNSYILSKFARHKFPATTNYELITIHYQILSTFYLSFSLLLLVVIFEIGLWLLSTTGSNPLLFLLSFICSIISLFFLHINCHQISGLVILCYIHLGNYIIAYILKFPIAAIFGVLCHMNLSYFVTQNNKLLFLNNMLGLVELGLHAKAIFNIFGSMLTDNLRTQLCIGALGLFIMFGFQSLISVTHKVMYFDLCNKVQVNYERSEDLTKEVVKVIQAKDQFVKSISHEVRNVLDSLNQSVEYLLTVMKDSAYIQVLRNVKISGEILLNLVNNALDAARIRAENLELEYEAADFEPIVRKALIINSQYLKQKNIFVQALIDTNLPPKLLIDSGRLLQVLVNLISNARKWTPNDGQIYIEVSWYAGGCKNETETFLNLIKPKDFRRIRSPLSSETGETEEEEQEMEIGRTLGVIRRASTSNVLEFSFEEESRHQKNLIALGRNSSQKLSVFGGSEHWVIKKQKLSKSLMTNPSRTRLEQREQFGYLKVQVSDTGKGMNEESVSKIFEVKNKFIGENDLTLWICKQICTKMNGEILCTSTINYGTDFVFYIPVNNVAEENPTRYQKDKVRALVVDDYDFNRNLHKLLLEREGVHVTLACDGKEALERYKEKGNDYYDIILMDIDMPVMDGITAAKRIREWEMLNGYKEAELVFISGDYFNEDEILDNWPRREGADNAENVTFMKKPIEIKRIVKIVDKYKSRLHKRPPCTLQNI